MKSAIAKLLQRKTYDQTRAPVHEALTLPPETYRNNDFFNEESELVFGKSWVFVGYTLQVDAPGKVLTTTVAGQPVVITQDKSGKLRGFFNVCRHRGSILVTNERKLERFRCPYHSWTYDLTGALLQCPLFNDDEKSFDKSAYHLLPVRVESFGCFIFVNLDEKAEPLSDYLGDFTRQYGNILWHELILVKRKEYLAKANWKLIAENFLEYYHLPWVHPELCKVTAIDMHQRNQGAGMYMSFFASPLLKGNTPLDVGFLPSMPGLSREQEHSGYFPFVFPNLAMFILPHHVFVLMINPTSVGTTSEYGDILVHKNAQDDPDFHQKLNDIFAFYDRVNQEDITAVERVHTGMQAKAYPGGRMDYRFEEPVHRFQNMWIDYVLGERRSYLGDGTK